MTKSKRNIFSLISQNVQYNLRDMIDTIQRWRGHIKKHGFRSSNGPGTHTGENITYIATRTSDSSQLGEKS